MRNRIVIGAILGGVAILGFAGFGLAALSGAGGAATNPPDGFVDGPGMAPGDPASSGPRQVGMEQAGTEQAGMGQEVPDTGGVRQALEGLIQIRQQQCQSGNALACQAMPQMPNLRRQLADHDQGCRSGDRQACEALQRLSRNILTSYADSAAVMRQGEQGMAQMNAWRGQMNRNAATSLSNLQAQAAAGQAAHEARQGAYAAMNQGWAAGQDSSDRNQGRYVDSIYGGTTMDGGGVQSRVDYGSTGYTDGYGNVVAVPNGGRAPDGWQEMTPTYEAPQ